VNAPTAVELIRELSERLGDFVLTSPEITSNKVQLVDPYLTQYLGAQNMDDVNGWVYGTLAADAGNVGIERRASSWTAGTTTLNLYAPGFPSAIQVGEYEIHLRFPRRRKLAALNAGVALMGTSWYRPIYQRMLTTRDNTYRYALDPTINWQSFEAVEIQLTTDPTLVGFPFESSEAYNPSIESDTDAGGSPPSGISSSARFPHLDVPYEYWGPRDTIQLVADGDVLPLPDDIGGKAVEWLYEYAEYKLFSWDMNRQPTGQLDRAAQQAQLHLQKALQDLKDYARSGARRRLIVPVAAPVPSVVVSTVLVSRPTTCCT
jgi:hypothetical protein